MEAKQANYGVQIEVYYADPAVDLDVDSNNDGTIDHSPAEEKMVLRGISWHRPVVSGAAEP